MYENALIIHNQNRKSASNIKMADKEEAERNFKELKNKIKERLREKKISNLKLEKNIDNFHASSFIKSYLKVKNSKSKVEVDSIKKEPVNLEENDQSETRLSSSNSLTESQKENQEEGWKHFLSRHDKLKPSTSLYKKDSDTHEISAKKLKKNRLEKLH